MLTRSNTCINSFPLLSNSCKDVEFSKKYLAQIQITYYLEANVSRIAVISAHCLTARQCRINLNRKINSYSYLNIYCKHVRTTNTSANLAERTGYDTVYNCFKYLTLWQPR